MAEREISLSHDKANTKVQDLMQLRQRLTVEQWLTTIAEDIKNFSEKNVVYCFMLS